MAIGLTKEKILQRLIDCEKNPKATCRLLSPVSKQLSEGVEVLDSKITTIQGVLSDKEGVERNFLVTGRDKTNKAAIILEGCQKKRFISNISGDFRTLWDVIPDLLDQLNQGEVVVALGDMISTMSDSKVKSPYHNRDESLQVFLMLCMLMEAYPHQFFYVKGDQEPIPLTEDPKKSTMEREIQRLYRKKSQEIITKISEIIEQLPVMALFQDGTFSSHASFPRITDVDHALTPGPLVSMLAEANNQCFRHNMARSIILGSTDMSSTNRNDSVSLKRTQYYPGIDREDVKRIQAFGFTQSVFGGDACGLNEGRELIGPLTVVKDKVDVTKIIHYVLHDTGQTKFPYVPGDRIIIDPLSGQSYLLKVSEIPSVYTICSSSDCSPMYLVGEEGTEKLSFRPIQKHELTQEEKFYFLQLNFRNRVGKTRAEMQFFSDDIQENTEEVIKRAERMARYPEKLHEREYRELINMLRLHVKVWNQIKQTKDEIEGMKKLPNDINVKAKEVVNQVGQIVRYSKNLNVKGYENLIDVLQSTHQVLNGEIDSKVYQEKAKKIRGESSNWNTLGKAMIALGVAMTALGVAIIVLSVLSIVPTFGFSLLTMGLGGGAAAGSGIALIAGGIGFFAKKTPTQQLSNKMIQLDRTMKLHP